LKTFGKKVELQFNKKMLEDFETLERYRNMEFKEFVSFLIVTGFMTQSNREIQMKRKRDKWLKARGWK